MKRRQHARSPHRHHSTSAPFRKPVPALGVLAVPPAPCPHPQGAAPCVLAQPPASSTNPSPVLHPQRSPHPTANAQHHSCPAGQEGEGWAAEPSSLRGAREDKRERKSRARGGRAGAGGAGGGEPRLRCSVGGGGGGLTPPPRLPSPSIPAALRLITAGELLRAAGGGDRREGGGGRALSVAPWIVLNIYFVLFCFFPSYIDQRWGRGVRSDAGRGRAEAMAGLPDGDGPCGRAAPTGAIPHRHPKHPQAPPAWFEATTSTRRGCSGAAPPPHSTPQPHPKEGMLGSMGVPPLDRAPRNQAGSSGRAAGAVSISRGALLEKEQKQRGSYK